MTDHVVRMWPRKAELDAITAILADESYVDESAMADAILKAAYDQILRRDWYVTLLGEPGKPACWGYGLSSTEKEADKLRIMNPSRVVKITSGETLKTKMKEGQK